MITCPWCGVSYTAFQPSCAKCGGPMPGGSVPVSAAELPLPPAPPRQISGRYLWSLLWTDGWWITAFVIGLNGLIFGCVGGGLVLSVASAVVGAIFLLLGMAFSAAGGGLCVWRARRAYKVITVLREGIPTTGSVTERRQNLSVQVNGRSPWLIEYAYHVHGQPFAGRVSTLNDPGAQLLPGSAVSVLYLPAEPQHSAIYPHP